MITESHNLIPTLTRGDIQHYVATHEFNEIGEQQWFRLIPHGVELFRTPEYGFLSGTELTIGDILWIASGLSTGYQARPYEADPILSSNFTAMQQ
ncbi:hypothetical protein SD10_01900 [Spirosoma radiotolerans]|uniref:Uncharacterized protein n=1 Tax=Spirosoma radiotolerans TaxID=1379870 RepID=A0A0E3V536_9BACT|nr:hypothetical protein SD10_01900 [Spirosoma radiotolerans]